MRSKTQTHENALIVCCTHSVGLDACCFHLSQELGGRELELILKVNLQQGVEVTNIILCTWGGEHTHLLDTLQQKYYD